MSVEFSHDCFFFFSPRLGHTKTGHLGAFFGREREWSRLTWVVQKCTVAIVHLKVFFVMWCSKKEKRDGSEQLCLTQWSPSNDSVTEEEGGVKNRLHTHTYQHKQRRQLLSLSHSSLSLSLYMLLLVDDVKFFIIRITNKWSSIYIVEKMRKCVYIGR